MKRFNMMRSARLKKSAAGSTPGSLMYNDFWNEDPRIANIITQLARRQGIEQTAHGKLRLRTSPDSVSAPWYFIRHGSNRDCLLWHDLFFNEFGIIHSACMSCWKVVIYTHKDPEKQTVIDLFRLQEVLLKLQLPSKCGCDVRNYTRARYAGFIYGDSLEQGLKHHAIVSAELKDIFPDANIILKRACTEYELRHPNSNEWRCSEAQLEFEEKLSDIFASTEVNNHLTTDFAQAQVRRVWIEYAYGIGDSTWREALIRCGYEDPGPDLYPPLVTYHDKTPEQLAEMFNVNNSTPADAG